MPSIMANKAKSVVQKAVQLLTGKSSSVTRPKKSRKAGAPTKAGVRKTAVRVMNRKTGVTVRRTVLPQHSRLAGHESTLKLTFRPTGYKCVVNQTTGRSMTGMHPALEAVCGAFDYDKAKKEGKLISRPLPRANHFEPMPTEIHKASRVFNTARQGHHLDVQIGQVTAWHNKRGVRVPLCVFIDKTKRREFFIKGDLNPVNKLKPHMPVCKQDQSDITKLASSLIPEALQIIHYFDKRKYTFAATQLCVARGVVGTLLDLVVQEPPQQVRKETPEGEVYYETVTGAFQVVELKKGCNKAHGIGRMMSFPLQGVISTTHEEYVLQTLMSTRAFRNTYPAAPLIPTAPCILLRSDKDGIYIYHPPAEYKSKEDTIGSVMRC